VIDLPTLNACLNTTSALLLLGGYVSIRRGRPTAHRAFMLAALFSSAAFLASYLVHHARVGSVPFQGSGPIRAFYLGLLLSHVVLAAAIVPMVLVTVRHAWQGRYADHRRWARRTLPLWAYVSVTGVVVYWMLYRL
jgi:putative membrane protein